MELAVPVLSFGGAFLAIFSGMQGIVLDFHYSALGCVLASCMLAYLAWLRPRKDIVALSTPIYSFIFFVVPTDISVGILLELVYAVSLTILLVRLKYRFGSSAPVSGAPALYGPLDRYVDLVQTTFPPHTPGCYGDASTVVMLFAEGEYDKAAQLASVSYERSGLVPETGAHARAFGIVAEQAGYIATGVSLPARFRMFEPEDTPFLFHTPTGSGNREQMYSGTLDNALLLLYATAVSVPAGGVRPFPDSIRKFAERLCDEK
jgi:hypothetical protein